jgi:hypothetical protein
LVDVDIGLACILMLDAVVIKQMLLHSQVIIEHVVLQTQSDVSSDLVDIPRVAVAQNLD